MNIWVQVLVRTPASNPSGTFPGVELLGLMATLCLIDGGATELSPTAAAPSHVPTSSVRGFRVLHILSNARQLDFLLSPLLFASAEKTGFSRSSSHQLRGVWPGCCCQSFAPRCRFVPQCGSSGRGAAGNHRGRLVGSLGFGEEPRSAIRCMASGKSPRRVFLS